EHWLADADAVQTELAGFSDQPSGMSQRPNRHRSVIGGHPAKLVASDHGCLGTQVGGTERGNNTCRSSADNDDIEHVFLTAQITRLLSGFRFWLTTKLFNLYEQ